jgi:3'(2'), 5'-bisphosphate nucleotidase
VEEVISGSVGIKCALVAQGAADLYVHPVPFLKEWDTCAPEAVLRGAGGRVTDCAGEPLTYGHPDPRQRGGIFAATRGAWVYARPIVIDISAPLFEGRSTKRDAQ